MTLYEINGMTLFEINGITCVIEQLTMEYLGTYWVGYAIFPAKYRDRVECADECPADVTWFNQYGIPGVLTKAGMTSFGKPLSECDYCYLGGDTAHSYNMNTEDEIIEILTSIVKWVKDETEV